MNGVPMQSDNVGIHDSKLRKSINRFDYILNNISPPSPYRTPILMRDFLMKNLKSRENLDCDQKKLLKSLENISSQ